MILLRANAALKVVFVKLINTMGRNFTWNDIFIIRNNGLVLTGSDKVMIFDFSNKVIGSNAVEVNLKEDSIIQITKNELLENVLNMTLYAFGKWGKIKGLTVERDYPQINALFGNILKEIEIEPILSADNLRLYRYGVQITYEDMIRIILEQQELKDRKLDEPAVEEVPGEEAQTKGKYDIGLWHKIVWKSEQHAFEKCNLTEQEKLKSRIGNNFYKVGCKCPICKEKLYMVIYPEGEELLVDTDEKGVYLARVYTCHVCHRLFTPKPHQLISEGSVYTLDFEEDKEAYEDYIEIIGKMGDRTYNCNFNKYENEYKQKKSQNDTQLEELCEEIDSLSDQEVNALKEKMDMGFYPHKSVERCERIIVKEVDKREQTAIAEKEKNKENNKENNIENNKESNREKDKESNREKDKESNLENNKEEHNKESNKGSNKENNKESNRENNREKNKEISEDNSKEGIEEKIHSRDPEANAMTGKHSSKGSKDSNGMKGLSNAEDDDELDSLFTLSRYREEDDRIESNTEFSPERKKFKVSQIKNIKERDRKHKKEYDSSRIDENNNLPASMKDEGITLAPYVDKEIALKIKAEACRDKDYNYIIRVMEEIKKEELSDELRETLLQPLQKLLEIRARKELNSLRQEIPGQISKKKYSLYKDRIKQYQVIDHSEDLEYLELRREEAEKQEIASFIKKANAKDRSSYMRLYQNLKKEGFTEKNITPYLENIQDRIAALDEAEIQKIYGDPAELTFERGLKAYEEITKRDLLPELKSNTLGIIDKRLTKIKMNECEQLVAKLSKDLGKLVTEAARVYFYDVRKGLRNKEEESAVINHALNTYASERGKYEFPILICDSSMKANGGRGFVLTPDHIFYNTITEAGILDVMKVVRITARRGRKIYAETESSGRIKLSNSLDLSNVEEFTEILNDFVAYLKEKPESRDIAYIAKEKHSVKCCYRCGHVYKGDNVCPKCGAKFNE